MTGEYYLESNVYRCTLYGIEPPIYITMMNLGRPVLPNCCRELKIRHLPNDGNTTRTSRTFLQQQQLRQSSDDPTSSSISW